MTSLKTLRLKWPATYDVVAAGWAPAGVVAATLIAPLVGVELRDLNSTAGTLPTLAIAALAILSSQHAKKELIQHSRRWTAVHDHLLMMEVHGPPEVGGIRVLAGNQVEYLTRELRLMSRAPVLVVLLVTGVAFFDLPTQLHVGVIAVLVWVLAFMQQAVTSTDALVSRHVEDLEAVEAALGLRAG